MANYNAFVEEILEDIGDAIDLDIETDEKTGKNLIELSLVLPEEAYRKFGPEAAQAVEEFIKKHPHEFINRFMDVDDLDWGEAEEQCMAVYEDNGGLKMVLNICCMLDDY